MRSPQQIKDSLTAASERRTAIHAQMVRGDISVDWARALEGQQARRVDRLLDELLEVRGAHARLAQALAGPHRPPVAEAAQGSSARL